VARSKPRSANKSFLVLFFKKEPLSSADFLMLQLIINGLAMGSIYALIALGLLFIFNAARIVNFAQGQLLMVGAFLTVAGVVDHGWPASVAYPLTLAAMALIGLLFMFVTYAPLRGMPASLVILTTIAMGVVIENLALIIEGPLPRSLPGPLHLRPLRFDGVIVSSQVLFIFAVTAILLLGQWLFLTRTSFGVAMQATAQDIDMARLVGIRVRRTVACAFMLGAVFAGIAGILVAPLFLAEPSMGGSLGLKAFVVSVLGGFGSLPGAVLGGLFLGVIETLASRYISSDYRDAYAFIILIGVLFLRPQGLLGEKISERV
jgi:branched-chain amino acid transport system permease protein